MYTEEQRNLFTGRNYYLELLRKNKDKSIVLAGPWHIGKTAIVRQFFSELKDAVPVYVDLTKAGLTPEDFAISLMGNVCFSLFGKEYSEIKIFMDIDYLLSLKKNLGKAGENVEKIHNELQKIKPNQRLILEQAFGFAEVFGEERKKKFVICLDEFWKIKDMDNFEQIKDVMFLFKNFVSQKNVSYVLTGSAIKLTKEIAKELDLRCEDVTPLDRDECKELAKKLGAKEDLEKIYRYSNGIPYYVICICKRVKEGVEKAFVSDLLSSYGSINSACSFILNDSLNRARGKTLLRSIVKAIAERKEMRLNEISRAVYRSSAVTNNLLSRLIDVDLIVKKDGRFSFSDPVLRYYVANELFENDFVDKKILDMLVKKLEDEL